jgi:hypothetical protein
VSRVQPISLQLMADVVVREDNQDILVAGRSGHGLRVTRPGRALRTLLDHLARGGMSRNALCDWAMCAVVDDRDVDLARLYFALGDIER